MRRADLLGDRQFLDFLLWSLVKDVMPRKYSRRRSSSKKAKRRPKSKKMRGGVTRKLLTRRKVADLTREIGLSIKDVAIAKCTLERQRGRYIMESNRNSHEFVCSNVHKDELNRLSIQPEGYTLNGKFIF